MKIAHEWVASMETIFPFLVANDDLASAIGIIAVADGDKQAVGIDGFRNI